MSLIRKNKYLPGALSVSAGGPTLLMCLLCVCFATACHTSQRLTTTGMLTESEVSGIQAAAVRQAPAFLNKIPAGHERAFGFDNREQFNRIVAGAPFSVCSIEPGRMLDDSIDGRAIKMLNEYRVPLIADGRARVLLTIEAVDGGWRATDMGAAVLAAEIEDTLKGRGFNIASTRQGTILRLYQVYSDFLITEDVGPDDEISVIPLKSARIALGLDRQEPFVSTLTKMLPSIKRTLSSTGMAGTVPDGVKRP